MTYEIKKPESDPMITRENAIELRYILGTINGFGDRTLLLPAVMGGYTHIAAKAAELPESRTFLVDIEKNPRTINFAFDTYKEAFEWYLK